MNAFRLSTVDTQKLAIIAARKDVKMTDVITKLVNWYWKEQMADEPEPQPVSKKELKVIRDGLLRSPKRKKVPRS